MFDQELYGSIIATIGSTVKRGPAVLADRIDISAGSYQYFY